MPGGSPISIRARSGVACWLLGSLLLAAAGCSSGKQVQWDLHTRELRLQEDEIYRLEDCIEDYQAIIRSLRHENVELKQSLGQSATSSKATDVGEDSATGERSLLDDLQWSPDRPEAKPPTKESASSGAETGGADTGDAPDIELPPIDGGELGDAPAFDAPPEIELPADASGAESEAPGTPPLELDTPFADDPAGELLPPPTAPGGNPSTKNQPAEEVAPPFEPLSLDDAVLDGATIMPTTSLATALDDIGPVASVAMVSESGPREPTGEATLIALVRPLSTTGETALFQGKIGLMLRDPQHPTTSAEIARWDYSSSEVSSAWRNLEQNPLLDFALILPAEAPMGRPLELWVRLVDTAGRKSFARTQVVLAPSAVAQVVDEPAAATQSATTLSAVAPPATAAVVDESVEAATSSDESTSGWTSRARSRTDQQVAPAGYWQGEQAAPQASEIRITQLEEAANTSDQQ